MKKYCFFLWVTLVLISCDTGSKDKITGEDGTQTAVAVTDSTTVQIIDSAYNFGKISDGEKVEYSYRFKNTGTKPLVIQDASASCGCTVPQKPEKPILPGETGFIKIVFDSKGRVGNAYKTVTVLSNANPGFPQLILTGDVEAKKE
ncbi:MAG: DUF1573 domain-containing protein [Chitinophagaceae bacterium]|nr:DUF1573 domain-containing protein [Chitinophagaceae bacterium]MBK9530678.1 DUF1573 domain-containing protein [Chitinophagaceae bacterium]